MTELPTPYSIAIGALISLCSDPKSPLVHYSCKEEEKGEHDCRPRSDAEWSLRLISLLHHIVLNEDLGYVILTPGELDSAEHNKLYPAKENVEGDVDELGKQRKAGLLESFLIKELDVDNVLQEFSFSSINSSVTIASFDRKKNCRPDGSVNFRIETPSTLLDRIDGAFYGTRWTERDKRSPPSQELLTLLHASSTSVEDLMNLLDSWHALLGGLQIGYAWGEGNLESTITSSTMMSSLDGGSTFGIFLRKLCIGMEEIPFEALGRLWNALRNFITEEITSSLWKRRQGGREDVATNADGDEKDYCDETSVSWTSSCDWLLSSPQIERNVRNTCRDHNLNLLLPSSPSRISHQCSFHPDSNCLSYNLLETHPECPSVHFLLFKSFLANGYRTQALESFHRYFDYAMIHERKERVERVLMMQASTAASVGLDGGAGIATTSGISGAMVNRIGSITGGMMGGLISVGQQQQQRVGGGGGNKLLKESNVMQYAATLLSQTYHRFGYVRLSLQATNEAIRVAQQNGDVDCVCFGNAWMAFVSSTLGGYGDEHSGARVSIHNLELKAIVRPPTLHFLSPCNLAVLLSMAVFCLWPLLLLRQGGVNSSSVSSSGVRTWAVCFNGTCFVRIGTEACISTSFRKKWRRLQQLCS